MLEVKEVVWREKLAWFAWGGDVGCGMCGRGGGRVSVERCCAVARDQRRSYRRVGWIWDKRERYLFVLRSEWCHEASGRHSTSGVVLMIDSLTVGPFNRRGCRRLMRSD